MSPQLHADVAWLAFLLGTWRGEGSGSYPTIEPFAYRERLTFDHVGDAWLSYVQESWSLDDEPLHFERGFLRPGATAGEVELVLAHPIGVTEVAHGRVDGGDIHLRGEELGIGRAATGMDVRGLERRYQVEGDALRYQIDMATGTTPMTLHLTADLRRDA
jgi:nitrobindin-like protein